MRPQRCPSCALYPCGDGPLETLASAQADEPRRPAARPGHVADLARGDRRAGIVAGGPLSPGVAAGGGVDPGRCADPVRGLAGGARRDQPARIPGRGTGFGAIGGGAVTPQRLREKRQSPQPGLGQAAAATPPPPCSSHVMTRPAPTRQRQRRLTGVPRRAGWACPRHAGWA